MLFDTRSEYDFMLVPVPSRPGITMPFTVDDLFTSKWVHTSLDYEHWENLGKYKRSVAVGSAEGSHFYSVHFSDQHSVAVVQLAANRLAELAAFPSCGLWLFES